MGTDLIDLRGHEEGFASVYALRKSARETIDGIEQRVIRSLVPESVRKALLSNGHLAVVPSVEIIDRYQLEAGVFEVAIPREWVKSLNGIDWCDRDPVLQEGVS